MNKNTLLSYTAKNLNLCPQTHTTFLVKMVLNIATLKVPSLTHKICWESQGQESKWSAEEN